MGMLRERMAADLRLRGMASKTADHYLRAAQRYAGRASGPAQASVIQSVRDDWTPPAHRKVGQVARESKKMATRPWYSSWRSQTSAHEIIPHAEVK